jgi:outer membrane protein OmpA-like peptidoglycan-associated protein
VRKQFVGAFVLAIVAGSARAEAQPRQQGFALNRYEASERGSEWFVMDSLDLRGKARPAIGLTSDWSSRPLVAYDINGKYLKPLIGHQFYLDPSASLVLFDRFRLGALVPVAVYESGRRVTTADTVYRPPAGNIGDIRVSGDIRLFGKYGDAITGALGSALYVPTGSRRNYTSDGNTRFAPRLSLAGDISFITYSVRGAFHYRPLTETFERSSLGSQIEIGGAAGVRVSGLVVGPEVFASTVVNGDSFLDRRTTPVEMMLSGHYTIKGFRFGAAAGGGVSRGWGAPAFRTLLSAEWALDTKKPAPPPSPPPPAPPVVVEPPSVPVVVVPSPAPPPDRDADRIPDALDACPDVPGEPNPDKMANGCPPDRDGDGIADKEDACPDVPGTADPLPKKNGCPLARIENGEIKISEQFRFGTASAELLGDNDLLILAIASQLKKHPEITKVRVEGHTDNTGTPRSNQKLSQERADSAMKALIKAGIDKKRLEARGFGQSNPLDTNETEEGRAANRRVELHILETSTSPTPGVPAQPKQ